MELRSLVVLTMLLVAVCAASPRRLEREKRAFPFLGLETDLDADQAKREESYKADEAEEIRERELFEMAKGLMHKRDNNCKVVGQYCDWFQHCCDPFKCDRKFFSGTCKVDLG